MMGASLCRGRRWGEVLAILALVGILVAGTASNGRAQLDLPDPLAGGIDVETTSDAGHLAFTLRGSVVADIHVENVTEPKINDTTESSLGFDAALQWFPSTRVAVLVRLFMGGQEFDPEEAAQFTGLRPPITDDSYMGMTGVEVGLNFFLRPATLAGGWAPYLAVRAGGLDWRVTQDGPGGAAHKIVDEPLEGTSPTFGFGFGFDYAISGPLWFEAELLWRFVATRDRDKWDEPDAQWGMTHLWNLSPGLVVRF